MSDELLPCPFCGESNAIICETDYEGNTEIVPAYAVSCRTKQCAAGIWSLAMGHFGTEQKAIKAWNTRADSKPYKYSDICEAWLGTPAFGKIGAYDAFAVGFTVARERKE